MTEQQPQRMQCMEVWGGSQLTTDRVEFGGLSLWVYSKPHGQAARGGDVYYASSCATGRITRLLLADVSGHGKEVAATAADLRLLMRRFVNHLDQREFVKLLNQQFAAMAKSGTFATAVVSTFFAPTRRLTICNAAHPRPLLYRAKSREWNLLTQNLAEGGGGPRNIPLGIFDAAEYENFDVELETGDCLLSYTDALIESRDANGEDLGEEGLLRIVRLLGDVEPDRLIAAVVKEIADRYPENLTADDVTLFVFRANGTERRHAFRDMLRAQMRMIGSLIRAINPKAERPPLPDANLANIGGAVIPALGRRWRAARPTPRQG